MSPTPFPPPSVSPYAKTKNLVWFARMVQKARLHADGKLGPDYTPWVGQGFDGRCLRLLKIEYPALLARIAEGGTDEETLEWCFTHGRRPTDEEILIFNEFMVKRGLRDTDNPGQVEGYKTKNGFGGRADLETYFDVIEADEGRLGKNSALIAISNAMPRIELTTFIAAPIERVFDLARSIDAHQASQSQHDERAVAGRTTGLIEEGEDVTWQAVHFGLRQTLSSRIVALRRPTYFRDCMIRGAFQRMEHDHHFAAAAGGTVMQDDFAYTSPAGILGHFADWLFLERYMRRLLEERNQLLKQLAESPAGTKYLET